MVIPIVLTGSSLGKRQQELNFKVISTAKENVPFEDISNALEKNDIDKLFKIDIASRYKRVDYIIAVLKSGDSLHVTRALKCTWLYDDDHSDVINPDYLHHNVFQDVSTKMKIKILTSISTHVRNEKRAEEFYNYCMNSKLPHQAYKFLIFSSSQLKADMIKNNLNTLQTLLENRSDLTYFIGNDVTLAESYLERIFESERSDVLHLFRYLYSINDNKYLDWLEKYWDSNIRRSRRLGRRISIDVIKKHKSRIFNNIPLYCTMLNNEILNKKSTVEEIKQYAVGLLPQEADQFWQLNFYEHYKVILDKIPREEKYHYIKKIFNDKYPNTEFEMSRQFYDKKYYSLMSLEEQESWALRHLSAKKSIFNTDLEDYSYNWFEFVNFNAALEGIKKYVLKTPDEFRRSQIVGVLVKAAKNVDDVEKLLNYYYQRHVNETQQTKESFLLDVRNRHNVFEFSESTFDIYDKLLYSINLYNAHMHSFYKNEFLNEVLMYHVIKNLEFPKCLKDYSENADFYMHDLEKLLNRLNDEQKEKVYQYLLQLHVERIKQLQNNDDGSDNRYRVSCIINFIKDLQKHLNKSDGLPVVALEYIKANKDYFAEPVRDTKVTQSEMLRLLKTDASLVVDKLDHLKNTIEGSYNFILNTYFNKIKTYFPESIAVLYLKFFTDSLIAESHNERRLMFMSVYAIFQLADETSKLQFLSKYLPVNPKIDHGVINARHLYIQEAICRFACFSRPPVPVSKVLQYVAGDYLKYCLPIFDFYLANLPPSPRLQFVESLINAPVSVQKHGLRLAFKCYDAKDLKKLIVNVWSKTKNVSLRMLVYSKLFEFLQHKDEQTQNELFKIVLDIIVKLNEDDHDDVFTLLTGTCHVNSLPQKHRGSYCETVYKTIRNFPVNPKNLNRLNSALRSIREQIAVMDIVFARAIVDDYLKKVFEGNQMVIKDDLLPYKDIMAEKRELTIALLALYASKGDVEPAKEIIDYVITGCLKLWNDTNDNKERGHKTYFGRVYLFDFIHKVLNCEFEFCSNYSSLNPILDHIRQHLSALPIHVTYILVWKLRVSTLCKMLIDEYKQIKAIDVNTAQIMMKSYASKVKEIVDEYISKGAFHLSQVTNIANAIRCCIEKLGFAINIDSNLSYDLQLFVSREFVSYKLPQTILLAIDILPNFNNIRALSKDCYKNVLTDIESVDNSEIQTRYYDKFAVNGFSTLL